MKGRVELGQLTKKVCQRCVNFLEDDGLITCDYEYFADVKFEQAILYVPEIFDCNEYEGFEEL